MLVAAFASYTALDLASRITGSAGTVARVWLTGGAFAMGMGIWCMHFIGMLAYISPIPLGYDVSTTLLSLLIAIVASGFALYVASRSSLSWKRLAAAGVIMGLAIVSMHYVGMAAVVLSPPLTHHPPLVAASIGVAIAASLTALAMAFKLRRRSPWSRVVKPASALIMGLAIAGMHYTAMAAVHIPSNAVCLSGAVTDKFWVAGAVTVITLMILSVALGLSLLDARVAARTARMSASLEHAQETNKAKDEFLAMLGHELRNPLAAISNAVALLSTTEPRSAAWHFAHEVLDRQSKHLKRIVDDLLDVGRAITGRISIDPRPLDLTEAVNHAIAAIKASGKAAKHRLDYSGSSVWISGDPTRIEQIATNLLTNALAYTPEGGSVWVRVERVDGQAVLTVEDDGIGLSQGDIQHVFDLFYQANQSLHRSRGGLGIGLTLVRRLVEMHGGAVSAASNGRGNGATFTVRFPALEAPSFDARTVKSEARERPRKIVLVEDDRDALESLRLLLAGQGHTVVTAEDGVSGLQQIRKEHPEVGIIDIGMPRMNGYELARHVRAERMPVFLIALTGYGQPEDMSRAREAGFDAHLTKPASVGALAELIYDAP